MRYAIRSVQLDGKFYNKGDIVPYNLADEASAKVSTKEGSNDASYRYTPESSHANTTRPPAQKHATKSDTAPHSPVQSTEEVLPKTGEEIPVASEESEQKEEASQGSTEETEEEEITPSPEVNRGPTQNEIGALGTGDIAPAPTKRKYTRRIINKTKE